MFRFRSIAIAAVAVATGLNACSPKGASSTTSRTASPKLIIVDDQKVGTALDHFSYSGHWERVTARRDGRYEGTSFRTFRPGDAASIMFYGRRFRLHGVDGPKGGSATLALDGRINSISFFARSKRMAAAYDSGLLPEGLHSVVIVVGTKPKSIAATGYVNIDYALIER
jgi:hypothetical protein